jgi:hypothetical protein
MIHVSLFSVFRVTVAVPNVGDIFIPSAVELVNEESHALWSKLAHFTEGAGVCRMNCRLAVAVYTEWRI